MAIEYITLNYNQSFSILFFLKSNVGALEDMNLSTAAGKTISMYLGVSGMVVMLVTNFYILRKRWFRMQKIGKLPGWLNFHIFCGMFGPSLILFHTDMKFGGLVALSFWSMMIVAWSGVIGRYFYIQVLTKKGDVVRRLGKIEKFLKEKLDETEVEDKEATLEKLKRNSVSFVGGDSNTEDLAFAALVGVFLKSIIADIKLLFTRPKSLPGLHPDIEEALYHYALTLRKINYFSPFQNLLGYWHSFHIPFAVIMYVVAAIHIAVALLFQV